MDWKYKHFTQEAVFKALSGAALEAARAVAADQIGEVEDLADGFAARGFLGWHKAIATFQITGTLEGTMVQVELRVERAGLHGFLLFDPFGYYEMQVDKWFERIAERLGGEAEQLLVRKTTTDVRVRRGCLTGFLVYVFVGVCLGAIAFPIDQAIGSQSAAGSSQPLGSGPGFFGIAASILGVLAGILAFFYIMYPQAPLSSRLRELLSWARHRRGREG